MSQPFDPYHKWLGISPKDQPPDHYRLLGIERFESDLEVIESAADQRMTHVRSFASGPHAAHSQRLLNEISAARLCLLDHDQKAAYDHALMTPSGALLPLLPPPANFDPSPFVPASLTFRSRESPTLGRKILMFLVGAVPAAIVIWILYSMFGGGTERAEMTGDDSYLQELSGNESVQDAATDDTSDQANVPLAESPDPPTTAPADLPQEPLSGSTDPVDSPKSPTPPDSTETEDPVVPEKPGDQPLPDESEPQIDPEDSAPMPPPRLAIPDEAALAAADKLIDEIFAADISAANSPELKAALARKLISAGIDTDKDAPDQYALWLRASQLASKAGDLDVALTAVNNLAAEFTVDELMLKRQVLEESLRNINKTAALRRYATTTLGVLDEAVAADRFDVAVSLSEFVLSAAKEARDLDLTKRVTRRNVDLKELEKECIAVREANKLLVSDPNDPAANRAVGKYRCFRKGEWARGLPMLALGNDPTLKELAELELSREPVPLTLGDAWWDCAAQHESPDKAPMQQRAMEWYGRAVSTTTGLVKAKVQQRLVSLADDLALSTTKNSIGMTFVLIPAGEFVMGSPNVDINQILREDRSAKREWFVRELPQHRVRITRPFYLGTYEVTQEEYFSITGRNPSFFCAEGDNRDQVLGLNTSTFPVEGITSFDAAEFCNALSKRDGRPAYYTLSEIQRDDGSITRAKITITGGNGYRLPTEAEWEYACRAGTSTQFHFGDSSNGQSANVQGTYPHGALPKGPFHGRTTHVGSYAPNRLALYDMHGNVWEFCEDWYHEDFYHRSEQDDPLDDSVSEFRVHRGGSWLFTPRDSRSASRGKQLVDARDPNFGFRIARNP